MFVLRLMFPTLTHQVCLHALDVMEVCLRASMRWGALTPTEAGQPVLSRGVQVDDPMVWADGSHHSEGNHGISSGKLAQSQCVGVAAPLLSTSHHLHQPTQLKCTDRVSVLTCPVCLPCVDQLSWFAGVLPWSEGTHLARGDKLGLKECACPEEHSPVLHLLKRRSD